MDLGNTLRISFNDNHPFFHNVRKKSQYRSLMSIKHGPLEQTRKIDIEQKNRNLITVFAEGQKRFSSNLGSLPIHDGAETRTWTSSDLKGFLGKLEPNDLMVVTLSNGELLYFEIAKKSRNGALDARCEGERFRITVPKDVEHIELEDINIENVGHWPPLSDAWIRSCPGLKDALKELRKRREQNGNLPSQRLSRAGIVSLDKVSSFSELENEVEERPSLWCDGTGPGDTALSSEESALLPAGEIISLLKGFRGIVLVQTSFPAVEDEVLVPLLRPYVLALLSNAAQTKGVAIKESVAAGGAVKSLILYSKQQPFKAWAQHLVDIGVQASLVADSPYYKLLIGKILGYKEENIIHHIESSGDRIDAKVAETVVRDLRDLSSVDPGVYLKGRK